VCRVVLNEHAAGRARAWEQRGYLCLVLCSGELSQRARLRFRRNPVLAKLGTARRTLPLCPQGNFQVSRDLLASDTPVCRSAAPVIDLRSWLPNGRRRKIGKSAGNGIDPDGLAMVALCLLPFLPESASRLHTKLGISCPTRYDVPLAVSGMGTSSGEVLLPRQAVVRTRS